MVQYSCSAVCESGKLGKIENHEKVNGFEVMASCSMTQTINKQAGFFRAYRTKLNRFLALVETADLNHWGAAKAQQHSSKVYSQAMHGRGSKCWQSSIVARRLPEVGQLSQQLDEDARWSGDGCVLSGMSKFH